MKATLTLNFLPPTLNEVIKLCKESPHAYARQKKQYGRDCTIAALGLPQFPGKVWIAFDWKIKTLRRDPDNTAVGAKCIMDALVGLQIIKDDSAAVIQPPIVHTWSVEKTEGVILTISDRPLFKVLVYSEAS